MFYLDEFSKQKLVWTPVNSEYRFTILPENVFFNNSLFMIVGDNIKFLCGILNSSLFKWYFNLLLTRGAYAYGSREFFQLIPIVFNSEALKIETIVEKLINNHLENPARLKASIDKITYDLYNLTIEERKLIKLSTLI